MMKLLRDFGGFLETTLERKMFFDLSMFDIQWENKRSSIEKNGAKLKMKAVRQGPSWPTFLGHFTTFITIC